MDAEQKFRMGVSIVSGTAKIISTVLAHKYKIYLECIYKGPIDMEKQRILIVHNYYQIPGGEDTVVENEQRMLEKHGHKTFLYSRNNSELNTLSKLQKICLPFSTVFNIKTYRQIKKIIKEKKIDIVHVHNTLNLISPSVYYAALRCKVPVVQTVHNFRLLCPSAVFYRDGHICEDCVKHGLWCAVKHKCYRNSRIQTLACAVNTKIHRMTGIYGKINYICLTEFNKEKLLSFKQISPERVFVKPNFVESINGEIVPPEKRADQFIFVGRLEKLKGVDVLLRAWKMMGDSAPKLLLCGNGPMEQRCREYIAKNGLESVEMMGFVPNEKVRKLVANSKALILPTQCYEGFPMTIAEAFAVGTPVIASDLGNAGSLVEEGVTGCKFAADSPEELKRAVVRLKGYLDLYRTIENQCAEKYIEEQNYESLMSVYWETD